MASLNFTFDYPKGFRILAQPETLRNYVHKRLISLWRAGVRAFIETVTETIVIDTGMSWASMIPLAERVRMKTFVSAAVAGARVRPRYSSTDFPGLGESWGKSAAHGEALARARKNFVLEFGTAQSPDFKFEFNIVVLQWYLHEYGLGQPNTHFWDSMNKGQEAFLAVFEARYPDILPNYLLERIADTGIIPTVEEL